ncbi:MAG: DUF2148 domain-containing protein [Candidatus Omnitrophota bacterium]
MKNIALLKKKTLRQIAEFICISARTAPKAKGIDNILTYIIDNDKEKTRLISRMREIAKKENKPGFSRDADNINQAPVLVLIGTKTEPIGLTYCGFCGYPDCAALKKAKGICAYNTIDLGIAVGSAVSKAADFRVDNRLMYSAGKAAIELNFFKDKKVKIALGIPLSATGKNPFFDRK